MTGRLHDFTNAGGAATAPGGAGANAGRCRGHARGVIGRWLLRCAAVVLLFGAAAAQAAITITPTSFAAAAPRFYTDTDVALRCNYEAFAVNSTLALADAWVRIESFGGGNLALGGADDGIYRLGAFTAGQTKTAFFYVCSSFTKVGGTKTAAGQTFSVNVYGSNPAAGGVSALQTSSYSLTIDDSSGANNSSTVSVIVAGPNPAVLGGVITMTVNGSGGNLGGSQPFAITPAAYTTWRADAFELFATNLSFAGSNSGSFDNQLYFGTLGAGATTYTATYYFRAVATTTAPAALSPIAYVDTSTSHTSTTNGVYSTALLPMDPATNALSLAKLVNTATLPAAGGAVSYTLRLTNSSAYAITADEIVDTLPAAPAAVSYVTNSSTLGGIAIGNPASSAGVLTWSGPFLVPSGASLDLVFQATIPGTPGLYTNTAIARISATVIDSTLTTTDNVPASAQTRVLLAPVIAKLFTPTATAVGGSLGMTITLSNPNPGNALTGVAFSDAYGGTLVNSTTPGFTTTCAGGTLAGGVAGGGSISISGVSLAAGASCTVSVDVTSASATAATNTTGTVSSANGGSGNTASAAYAFTAQPTLVKSFIPAFIAPGASSVLRIVVTNNSVASLTGLAWSDSFPANLTVAATPGLINTCGGTVTGASAGATAISLAGGLITLPATTCQIDINVTAPAGIYQNSTSGAASNIAGTGPVSNIATLTVNSPPAVTKAFSPAAISRNGTSTLTVTLTNPNATALTGVAFTDTYPANLVNALTAASASSCGGSVVASPNATNPGTLTLTGGSIAANASCIVTVNVTAATAASYPNAIAIGGVTAANAAASTVAATATLAVSAAPSLLKSFSAAPATGIATMTLVITNHHPASISGIGFTDTLPAGLTVSATPALANTCNGTPSAVANGSSVSLTGGTIAAAGGTCTITVSVVAAAAGLYVNQTSGVASSAGTGSPSNVATLIAPALSKTFSPAITGPGDTSRLTIRVTNPSLTTALSGVQFADTYPSNLTNTAAPAAANTCGGTLTVSGNATNPGTLTLTGGAVAAGGSCSVSVNVSALIGASPPTSYYNQTGTVRSSEGIGIDTADTLIVTNRPTITKSFSGAVGGPSAGTFSSASAILLGESATLRLVLENNHTAAISSISFSDALPPGMTVAGTPSASNGCNGTLTAAANATSISLSGGSIATASPTGTCTITVNVTASPAGSYSNQTSGVSSTTISPNPGPPSNVAVLTVNLNAPTVAKSFTAPAIAVNGTSTLTVSLTNPVANSAPITGLAFTDTYPAGLTSAGTPATTCGGSVNAAGGGNTLTLAGGAIPVNSSCSVTVSISAATAGSFVNTLPAGGVTTTDAGSNGAAAAATLNVFRPPTVVKSFTPSNIAPGGTASLVITVGNPVNNPANLTGVSLSDVYNGTLVNNAAGSVSCSGGSSATLAGGTNGGTSTGLTGGTLAPGGTCVITQSVSATSTNNNTSGAPAATGPVALNGTAAAAILFVVTPPTFSKAFASPKLMALNGNTTLTFTLTNPNSGALTGSAFTDDFPAGMSLFNTTLAGTCAGGTLTSRATTGATAFGALSAGHISIQAAGFTIPALGSCTVVVNLTSSSAGAKANTTSVLTTAQGTVTAAASDTLNVYAPPTVTKTFTPSTIAAGSAATMEIAVTNPAANPGNLTGVSINDVYTGTLVNHAAGTVVCTGAGSATLTGGANAGTSAGFSGGTVVPGGTCTVTQAVTATATNNNTTGAPAATGPLALTGSAASATLTVTGAVAAPDLTLSKVHSGNFLVGSTHAYTLTPHNTLGTAPTSAPVTITDTLPAGLTYVAAGSGGSGWTCSVSGQVVTCVTSAAINNGASGNPLTINVLAGAAALPAVTNSATVAGGGEPGANTGNNTATDPTAVVGVNSFNTDGAQTVMAGGTTLYTHQFNAGSAGTISFSSASIPSPAQAGWFHLIYRDNNCNGVMDGADGSAVLSAAVAVVAADMVCILVKEFVPAGASSGAQDQITVTAAFVPTVGAAINYTRFDLTTVGVTGMLATKEVRNVSTAGVFGANNTALPGHTLEYRITYTNTGTSTLTGVIVNDTTPAYTTYVGASAGCPGLVTRTNCTVVNEPANATAGTIQWSMTGTFTAGATATVSFQVKVD